MIHRLILHLTDRIALRAPDFVIGGHENPYMLRWFVLPRNPFFNIYLHRFVRSDDDRALHDHPWGWMSYVLAGAYVEHTIAAGGIHHRRLFQEGSLRIHRPRFAHRLELRPEYGECWTLFITGPKLRKWGFHCPESGWVYWRAFTDPATQGATIGRGCDQ